MVDFLYNALDAIFGPVLGMRPMLAEIVIALVVTFLITLLYRFLSKPKEMKELREKAKELSKEAKELQKTNPEEAKKATSEMMKITNKQMMSNMKPMLGTLLIAVLFLPWMAERFVGQIVLLPFDLPYFGADFGWLMWYILVSIPFSQIFRKILGVDL